MNVAQGFQKASARHECRSRTRGRPLAIAAGLLLALTGCSDDSPALDVSESELVTGTLPDVVITSLAYAGGKFTCTVKNKGAGPTPSGVVVGVGYSVDGVGRTWGAVPGPLAAGASITIRTDGGAYAIADGTHKIAAYVDDVNRFTESDETNNIFSASVGGPSPTPVVGAVAIGSAQHEIGNAYWVAVPGSTPGDTMDAPKQSTLKLYENGTELGPAHSLHADIRALGSGRFSHWGDGLYFSTSDNSDPRTNGRTYTYRVDATTAPAVDLPGTAAFTPPVLVKPVNPMNFGAKCDGVTDDSTAFQNAIDAGDVLVPAKTCLINRTVRVTTSHKHIECTPGAILRHTDPYAFDMIRIVAYSDPITDISIVNCHFLGTNTVAPQYFENDDRHWDIPVRTLNTVNDFYVAGNTFERFFGQSMVQTYAPVNGGSGARIEYNTFKSCGYYGPVLVASVNGTIGHNTMVDCATGVENDNPGQISGGNVIEHNTLSGVNGYGAPDMGASVMLTGGGAGKADYSGNIVRYNTISGRGSAAKGNLPAIIYHVNATGAAQYVGNTCGEGCIVIK